MKKRLIEKERFQALDEKGRHHEIICLLEQIDVTTLDDTQQQWADGQVQFRLTNGSAVNQISDTEFDLITLGVKATRI